MADSKPSLSISFHNFWSGFEAGKSFFFKAIAQRYDVTIDKAGRDLQISSVFGKESLPTTAAGRPLRVWWTGEQRDPQAQIYDLYFGFCPRMPLLGACWYRFPFWINTIDWWDALSASYVGKLLEPRQPGERSRFCNFIYSNDTSVRAEFFLRLNAVRAVQSYGTVLNNTGIQPKGWAGKMAVLGQSTFTIAFENSIGPGYVTEKLVQPLLAGSIPIYWGAPEARTDFNPDAFIAAEDFSSMDDLVGHVVRIADSPDALGALVSAPPFIGNKIPYEHTPEFFVDRISDALSGPAQSVMTDRLRSLWRPKPPSTLKSLELKIRRARDKLRAKGSPRPVD